MSHWRAYTDEEIREVRKLQARIRRGYASIARIQTKIHRANKRIEYLNRRRGPYPLPPDAEGAGGGNAS